MSMNLSIIHILNIENAYYCCIIYQTSKSEAIKWLQNIDLAEVSWKLQKREKYRLKKHITVLESIYENGKNNYKIWWYWNRK